MNTKLVVVIAPGKRPATFRTWKLSPAAPMVLQPPGCGRVGHRHNTRKTEGLTQQGEALHTFIPSDDPACAGARNVG